MLPLHAQRLPALELALEAQRLLALLAQLALGAARGQLRAGVARLRLLDRLQQALDLVARARNLVAELRNVLVAPLELRVQVAHSAVDAARRALRLCELALARLELLLELFTHTNSTSQISVEWDKEKGG